MSGPIKRPLYHYVGAVAYIRADDVAERIARAFSAGRACGSVLFLTQQQKNGAERLDRLVEKIKESIA